MGARKITETPAPPRAERRTASQTRHGITRSDDYAWLRAQNWQEVMRDPASLDPAIRAYLEAENAYTDDIMDAMRPLRKFLFDEMKGRIKEDDSSPPSPDGAYAYYTRYVTGGEHPLFCRKLRAKAGEEILIDCNALAQGHAYFRVGGVAHSPDHKLIAYARDTKGSEFYDVRVLDIDTNKTIGEPIPDTSGGAVWANDGRTLFYTRLDGNHRPSRVFRHELGAHPRDDVLVYEEEASGFFVGVGLTQSRKFITINAHDHQTSEIRLIDADRPETSAQLISTRKQGREYSVEHHGECLVILTNADDAEDFKLVETPLAELGRENWRDIEPHRSGRLILDHVAYSDHLVWIEHEEGLPRIIIRRFVDGVEHTISFDEEIYALGLSAGYECDTETVRFSYSSMTTPVQVFDYDMETRERLLRKTQEVPSGHNPSHYVTRRVMAPADDGETVPVSLLYRADTKLDGAAPLLLYGYGAYGITIPAGFSTSCLSLVDRGVVYAIANVRGGRDKGHRWYKAGRRDKKINTFSDFIAAATYLTQEKFTSPGRIIAHGGSAGGMLMGAVANIAPELFGGIIAEVPFVDVLNTMLDDTLPLTPPEWPEWGNPIESAEEYGWIAAYSPYDNIKAQDYPNILCLAGLTDPRVTYWESAKWIAKLRALKTDANLTLLKTNMEAGHAGASGRFDRLKEVALAYAFALKVAGKT